MQPSPELLLIGQIMQLPPFNQILVELVVDGSDQITVSLCHLLICYFHLNLSQVLFPCCVLGSKFMSVWKIAELIKVEDKTYICVLCKTQDNSMEPGVSYFPRFIMTVNSISTDPPCKNGNARFTTIPFETVSDQVWNAYFCLIKLFVFIT